jgi:hypothetical protein
MATVSVTVADDHLGRIDEIVAELRREGMRVDQVLKEVGVITGSVPDDRLHALDAVPGVESVEGTTTFQLPPPDSPIQ